MKIRRVKRFYFFLTLLLAAAPLLEAKTTIKLTGEEIPKRLFIGKQRIFIESDSLYFNGRLLIRNVDYLFDDSRRAFDLSRLDLKYNDTLLVTYEILPDWLEASYGRPLPTMAPQRINRSNSLARSGGRATPLRSSDITISGAKSFRFSARSAGASEFSQSLDLRISGGLMPGLEITGAVSDRGYDPAYGPSNSRLNELDRINLQLKSDVLTAQIGDMAALSRFDESILRQKRVSGAAFNVHTRRWYAEAMAARPKGRFETFTFLGVDGLQGPYQIGRGAKVRPIVPGSEQVWLDGELLELGAHKDYIIDYPTGQITFTVKRPIDGRSRIEIDYEPRATDFRGELLSTGGGVSLDDSSAFVAVEWLREGDDRNQPLTGELSNDEMDILAAVGDNVGAAVRSGVTPDSGGSYILVADSLPDSVYRYVGQGNGNHSISFSFVGSGKGDYRFLGGRFYEFVGVGQGDYLPIEIIPAPERTDYYNARIGMRNDIIGQVTAELRQTQDDRNLFSNRDDHDNRGSFYLLSSTKEWRWNDQPNRWTVKSRRKEAAYKARDRLYPADFRRNFLLPGDYVALTDETLYELGLSVSPSHIISLSPSFSRLDYQGSFESSTEGLRANLSLHPNLQARLGWKSIKAYQDSLTAGRAGEASTYTTVVSYRLSRRLELSSSYEYDRRENEYSRELRGTRYNQYLWALDAQTENLSYEYYVEDSLMGPWHEILSRNRLAASSSRKLGLLAYNVDLTYQWLKQDEADAEDFLGRMQLQYRNARKRVDVSASYSLSEETRNARGISYLEVEQGQGDYIFENGEYIPDPDGNFIRMEEILSDRSRVSRGEKSFHLSKDFKTMLVRLNSTIQEELLNEGKRNFWWAVPFLSDETQPYLFYLRRYDADIRLLPIRSAHAVNVTLSENREIRDIAGAKRKRRDTRGSLTLKQVVKTTFLEESLELFQSDRDSYFSGAGKIDGYEIGVTVRQLVSSHEISAGGSYRQAEAAGGERSETYSVQAGSRLRVIRKGELRSSLELYRQMLANTIDLPSFQLTGNRPGNRGAIWSISVRYGLRQGFRINVSLSGRHSDDRAARITGHGEMVAGF